MAKKGTPKKVEPKLWYLVTSHDQVGRRTVRMDIIIDQVEAANDGDENERRKLWLRYMAATGAMIPRRWGEGAKGLSVVLDADQAAPFDPEARPPGRPRKASLAAVR